MTSLFDVSLPAGFLVFCLNAAVASFVACAIAVVLIRCSAWSLPARHAVLVAALVVSLTAPLVTPLFHFSSVWAIPVSWRFDRPPTVVEPTPIGGTPVRESPDAPMTLSLPGAETDAGRPRIGVSAGAPAVSVVADRIASAPFREQPSVTTPEWARIIGTLVCGIWFVGIAVGLGRAILSLVSVRRWIPSVSVADNPLIAAAARSAAEGVGLRTKVAVYRSTLLPAPVTVGLLRSRIVVPAGIESNLSFDQLRAVIRHELAHIARRDLWVGLLQQTAQIVYWWNPLVHLANRQLANLREQICDDIALRGLAKPGDYATTLVNIAERSSLCAPVPATLGIGSSPARQLESRIRRIMSLSEVRQVRLTRLAAVGVSAAVALMTATILLAQVQVKSVAREKRDEETEAVQPKPPADKSKALLAAPPVKTTIVQNPTLHDLVQQMAAYERMYLPFEIKAVETFRFPEDLTPQERAKNPRADGRKHQRLMEYAQIERRIWRSKETSLVDDEVEQGPYEQFSDGERIIQVSPSPVVIDGKKTLEYYINNRKNDIFNYLHATPLGGVFCLSAYSASELFSEAFKADEEGVDLAWDNGDAKLTFTYGKPYWNTRYVLWLSRAHAWHPIRWQRYWDAKDSLFFDEWEVTRFDKRGNIWRVVEGTHRYRDRSDGKLRDPKIKYSMDWKVLEQKYGSDVDPKQFQIQIPAGAVVRDDKKPVAEPPPPTKTRAITVTVVDAAGKPIRQASVRLPVSRFRDLDKVATDERGVARSAMAPAGDATVQITATGFRPVTWIMGAVNELRAIMVPRSPGLAVHEGKPVADAWITNEPIQIRADGFTYVPQRDWDGKDKDWTGADGRFELKSNLTLRRLDVLVPYIAVDPSREKMAIQFIPAREMGQPQELVLRPVCHVRGHCLLEGMTESVEVDNGLENSTGASIGFLSTRRELTPDGLRVDFEMRLPPGAYVLRSRESSHHAGFQIPFTIDASHKDLDLGTKTVSPTGALALKGKPAPTLQVQSRPGKETNWEKLRGKVVVLDFWGTWCIPCVAAMPELMEIHDQFRAKPVAWLAIHTPNLKTFAELDGQVAKLRESAWNKRDLPFMTVMDSPVSGQEFSGKTSQSYGVAEWPTLIVVDQKGNVVGPVPKKKLADVIGRLLGDDSGK